MNNMAVVPDVEYVFRRGGGQFDFQWRQFRNELLTVMFFADPVCMSVCITP